MAVALQPCPALVLGQTHPSGSPGVSTGCLPTCGHLIPAVLSTLPRWVCTKVFEPISTQPPGTGISFPLGLFHQSVTSPFSPTGGKDTSPATTSPKPEIPWRSLSKRGHGDLAGCTWLETFSNWLLFYTACEPRLTGSFSLLYILRQPPAPGSHPCPVLTGPGSDWAEHRGGCGDLPDGCVPVPGGTPRISLGAKRSSC